MKYDEYTVTVSSDPSYYGSAAISEDGQRIADALSELIEDNFLGININRVTSSGERSATRGPELDQIEEIDRWIQDNWTAAL